jgi:hypothetical protein
MFAFPTSPGGAYATIRNAYRALSVQLAKYTWIEAELFKDSNFSETIDNPACSAGKALSLRTSLPSDESGYYATYPLEIRSQDVQEVWLAGRIPPDRRPDVKVIIGGQTLSINTEPISLYGNGYGWYKLGVTRLAGDLSEMRLEVHGDTASDLAIDTLMLSPKPFTPHGVWQPDPIVFSTGPIKRPKEDKRRH